MSPGRDDAHDRADRGAAAHAVGLLMIEHDMKVVFSVADRITSSCTTARFLGQRPACRNPVETTVFVKSISG